ncbi:flagellar brake protein [Geodermatophilus sp. URMC 61]|uniref:flagellar brake protein n=1 Tax=Geodermatophilus sp. URMC 61 TaxID=3423411 RepID=UPI00406CE5E8
MDAVGAARPEVDDEAEVTPRDHRYPVSTRVERVTGETVVVRPSVGDFADQEVVWVGDHVQVFWRDSASVWALPAQVTTVERGAAPRWHLAVVGPAEAIQRRQAVRARLAVPLTAVLDSVDLAGEVVDLSERGLRAVLDASGDPPPPGTVVPLTVHLEGGDVTSRAEVVWHHTRGGRWGVSLRFLELSEKEQDRVRRRVFQAMREERARGSS